MLRRHLVIGCKMWMLTTSPTFHPSDYPTGVFQRQQQVQEFSNRSSRYVNNMFAPSLIASMNDLSLDSSASTPSPGRRYSLRRGFSLSRLFNRSDSNQGSIDSSALSPQTEQLPRMTELIKAYQCIDETIRANRLCSPASIEDGTMKPSQSLVASTRLLYLGFRDSTPRRWQ